MTAREPVFTVGFDEITIAEDVARVGRAGAAAIADLAREIAHRRLHG